MKQKMDELIQVQSKLTSLEDKLKKISEKVEKRAKSELETIIDSSDEIIVDNQIKDKQKTENKTRLNKKYLDKIISECKEAAFIVDKKGILKETNVKMESALGYKQEEFKDMKVESIFPTADRLKKLTKDTYDFTQRLSPLYKKKQVNIPAEDTFIDKKKNAIPFLLKTTALRDSTDQLIGVVFLLRDFVERKKIEDEILKEKQRLEKSLKVSQGIEVIERLKEDLEEKQSYIDSIIESSVDGILVVDTSGYIKRANKSFAKLLGYQPHQLIGKHTAELAPYEEDKEYFSSYDTKIAGGKVAKINLGAAEAILHEQDTYVEFYFGRKDGIIVPVWGCTYWIRDKKGQGLEAVVIARDLTEKKRDEMKLQDSYEKLEEYSKTLEDNVAERTKELEKALTDIDGIIRSVADGMIVTDVYNRIIMMNRPAEDLLGIRLSEVINRPIDFAIQDKILRDRVKSTLEKKKTGYEFDFELSGNDPKHPLIMRARTSVIYDKEGKQTGIVTIIHDVTQEREVDRMKTEFISTAAHELRTPLTSIQGFSEIMFTRDDISEEERKKFSNYINKQAISLTMIVSDLLDIARLESGKGFSIDKVICNIGDIINKVIPYYREQANKHHFEVVLPEKPVELYVDKQKMEQVFRNLISNAVKYSPDGGLIQVSGRVSDGHFEVSVKDQGVGMTPEQVEKIFDKFYRVDTSDKAIEGTGLGMTIVKHIVEVHGGKIWVESEPGKGTSVRFMIPV